MSKNKAFLTNAYQNAYRDFDMKLKYTEPIIYDAGGDLTKRWYVYYRYLDPVTGKLQKQTPVYLGVNKFKTLADRREAISILRKVVSNSLKNGFSPYEQSKIEIPDNKDDVDQIKSYNVVEAVKFVLDIKKTSLKETSYKDFKSRVNQFKNWLIDNKFGHRDVKDINATVMLNYLNHVQIKSSPANRNNTRNNLSGFFTELKKNFIITENPILETVSEKTTPERHKSYSVKQEKDIFKHLSENDPLLLLFIKFVSYNFLRPIEVVRLQIKDVDIIGKKLFIRTKNKPVKVKIIPDILLKELPDLDRFNPNDYLFTPYQIGGAWETEETNRRGYFSDRFKTVVKDKFNLGIDYGLYSFRHTFITKLYNEFVKKSTPFEAKSKLMLITGHTTMSALEKYLREIDAILPDDYSDLIK